ncbi:MAG: metallophosphoesterase family protein [Candidatus Thorarchaeota archaeon]
MSLRVQETVSVYNIADEPAFLRGPTVNRVTNNSAMIFWRTPTSTDAYVYYGFTDANLNMTVSSLTPETDHSIVLNGLELDTTYYYRVESDSIMSEIYHFKTAPANGGKFSLFLVGDNRPEGSDAPIQPDAWEDIVDMGIAEAPHIVVLTGDFVYRLTDDHANNLLQWEYFNNITDRLGHYAPIYGVLGNHDTGAGTGAVLKEYFLDAFQQNTGPSTYFSFDYAGVHFTMLDTEEYGIDGRITGTQYDWLVNDLESTSLSMKFVFGHQPLYPIAHIGSALDQHVTERDRLQQLFEDQNVTLYGTGHDHLYNRLIVNGVVHIISGGGGAPLYGSPWGGDYYGYVMADVQSNQINFTSIKLDGSIAEEYQLPHEGPIEIEIRSRANTTTNSGGWLPEIYFSEVPITKYFSWDDSANATELSGLPIEEGLHTLDIYAEDDEGVWAHSHLLFTSTGPTTTESTATVSTTSETTTPPPSSGFDPTLLLIGVGVTAVIVIIMIWRFKMR